MSDVTVTLNNTEIATLDDTGIARLKTSGKHMPGDVLVQYEKPSAGVTAEPLPVTANGTYTAPAGKAYSPVTVTVPTPETQTRTATPSLSTQSITPDSGKLLSAVTVNPITASLLASLDPDFIAANIADGVNMFGVVGTMPGVFVGSFTLTNRLQNTTVTHGLGRVPSGCAIRISVLSSMSVSPVLVMAYGTTSGVLGITHTSSFGATSYSGSITDASASSGSINWIYGANSTTISFGTVQSGTMEQKTYFFTLW